ncbi:predicted protein, partial [Nematostella vectensis]
GVCSDGIYTIALTPSRQLDVFCDLGTSGGGWTVIQRRMERSVDFYRGWDEYKWGFGDKNGEFWLGLENIHVMTSQKRYRLRFDMEDFEGNTCYAEYDGFKVGEVTNYKLVYMKKKTSSGDAENSFGNVGREFTTKDRDHDAIPNGNCAYLYKGAWWHNSCHATNSNGLYLKGENNQRAQGVIWMTWKGWNYSLKRIEMKVKPI